MMEPNMLVIAMSRGMIRFLIIDHLPIFSPHFSIQFTTLESGNTMASSAVHTQLRADFRLGRSSVLSAGCCNTDTLNTPDD